MSRPYRARAFTLVEILFVLAIISMLAALLLPVFFTAQGKARQVACASNLRQIGMGVAMYAQDYDGLYPFAVDPSDKYTPRWKDYPEFEALIPAMPMVHDALQPYTKSKTLFRCPSDTGYTIVDFTLLPLDATPTSYEKHGTSYYYNTDIARTHAGEMTFQNPVEHLIFSDAAGKWHGGLFPLVQRYNFLFADGHVKNMTYEQAATLPGFPL